ncbi:(R)-benzylsuccinyl-CoA dehydrogenase [Achromobacter denitrificans]|uniref:acyl-CoA dehydrogenase family protein n=1 Tax=Achromobacter denitrificans TaxID=32002 RepID=UPI0007884CC3|nr:acyl-CoA dehydrogenase family protein [Achromobacter denitrificans]OLU10236.1 acyl-CoA dehydrogenase [Achromobacter denitrificans]QKH43529.1 acyl-CoA dehydrogenase family protein [Achromobacter denitrificans]QKH49330.1 acyl-CoA dehydrogenase family protein [Achromobacter denitrificans]CAB3651758.1 (R)-benzylsuccinyl-CoA dehydrogenase [Achromobacter denitrificans]SUU12823.1 (R)-benzylsuccinyl-CoA dehydrogenase [Achromobacter denitrificans]
MHPKQEHHDDDRVQDLCERVRRFVDEVAIPAESPAIARDVAALDRSVARLRVQARDAGLYAPQLPEQWGGLGLDWRGLARVLEEAGRGFLGPAALNCAAPDQPNMLTLLRLGSPAQQARYLAPLVRGEQRACFAMTEPAPGAGSDPSMLRTRAARRGKRWVLDGHKQFISGGVGADFALVLARAEEGVTLFLVPADTPGYRVVRDIGMVTGYQIGGHAEILLDGCEVGEDAVLGEPGRGLEYAQLRLEPARLSHCMRYIGRARRALETAQAYVARRDSFGARLADLQQIQAMVADSHIDLHASRLMTLDCAGRMDAGLSVKQHSAMAKVFVSEAVNRVADRAVQMMGASGLSDDTPVAMVWQEMRPFRIYDGANELHRATLARRLLAQP